MGSDLHERIGDELARSRQRYTAGRRSLVELLRSLGRPVTIPELRDGGARQSQSSLYRNLAVLELAGVVRRMTSVDDVARFELSEDLTEHHHHVRCVDCGRVDDLVLTARVEGALQEAAVAAGDQLGYDIGEHDLELVGTCGACRPSPSPSAR